MNDAPGLERPERAFRIPWPARWRARPGGPAAGERLRASVRRAELDGLAFAFRARTLAVVAVTLWLVSTVAWPRDVYYASLAGAFFVLGYIPYRWRHHRHADWIKCGFILLDVALVTAAIVVPPPLGLGVDWPIQQRLRGQEYLFLLLLLGEAALTYSAVLVLWTGIAMTAIWSVAILSVYRLPDTRRFADAASETALTSADALRIFFEPTFVSLTGWRTQVVATALFTCLLALAVWRSRRTLLAQVQAEVVRAELARYVSPDIAEALTARGARGFGQPSRRHVAILYADIVGFTRATEHLTPERTFALLRSFHERGCRTVFEHDGTLDKYLGDGFMATFGGLEDRPDSADRALACAFALRDEIERWNAKRHGRGASPVAISIGVHCGPVVVGNLGAERRIDFTVVGDVVNVASRLEEATRELGATILASDACVEAGGADRWATRFDAAQDLSLRGRASAIRVHVSRRRAGPGPITSA